MNRPCRIHFHEDKSPWVESLPERYQANVEANPSNPEIVGSIIVQNAFYVDYAPSIIRTRVGGTKKEDPVDFQGSSITHIEWFYGDDVPEGLVPDPGRKREEDR